ncbi:hypothetical protein ACIBG5_13405 [Kribbella sp. NPDC050241]|uniref:hypothetical protein n=1 Tax=Kribbella sp. NPDC050241 TaxID=3364115 RepID=UPI0037920F02
MAEEQNAYKGTLNNCKTSVIPNARDAIYHGSGNPADSLLSDLSSGGWACTSATEFSNTLRGKTGTILGAFDDAVSVVNAAWSKEPDEVPENDWRGNAWPKQWSMRNM